MHDDARARLDAWTREMVAWHFDPATGSPFWLERARTLGLDPRRDVSSYADLRAFGFFEDEWLRGGPVRRWVPQGLAGQPVSVFETGGSTGIPKSRANVQDFKLDYEAFSDTLPDAYFPKGADWLSIGPSGPRRLRRRCASHDRVSSTLAYSTLACRIATDSLFCATCASTGSRCRY